MGGREWLPWGMRAAQLPEAVIALNAFTQTIQLTNLHTLLCCLQG